MNASGLPPPHGALLAKNDSRGHNGSGGYLLSIVTPFFNSVGKADRVLSTLGRLNAPDVELLFIDDGSTDGTLEYLEAYRRKMHCRCVVLRQDSNRGPGAARNHGLSAAAGRYVWFVDSDDDINLDAVSIVRALAPQNYDFVDFDIQRLEDPTGRIRPSQAARAGRLKLAEGAYDIESASRVLLLNDMGWVVTKVYSRDFLHRTGLRFPEHCVYEDFPWFFWLPLVVTRFYKSDAVGYYHHQDGASVTRSAGRKGPRFYDRLWTIPFCVRLTANFHCTRQERLTIEEKFTKGFLFHTMRVLMSSGDWLMIPRIMKRYREEAVQLKITRSPFEWLSGLRLVMFGAAWGFSYCYRSQAAFFRNMRREAWGERAIVFPDVLRCSETIESTVSAPETVTTC